MNTRTTFDIESAVDGDSSATSRPQLVPSRLARLRRVVAVIVASVLGVAATTGFTFAKYDQHGGVTVVAPAQVNASFGAYGANYRFIAGPVLTVSGSNALPADYQFVTAEYVLYRFNGGSWQQVTSASASDYITRTAKTITFSTGQGGLGHWPRGFFYHVKVRIMWMDQWGGRVVGSMWVNGNHAADYRCNVSSCVPYANGYVWVG